MPESRGEAIVGGGLITLLRRTLVAIGAGLAAAALVRVRGSGGIPPQTGGWRELRGDDLR
ncbi:MAG: hypothetical protein AAGC53_12545 [Actinomycetota bacterium]